MFLRQMNRLLRDFQFRHTRAFCQVFDNLSVPVAGLGRHLRVDARRILDERRFDATGAIDELFPFH